jgi:hypothetical protein
MVGPGGWAKRLAEHLGQGLCGAVIVMEGARVLEVWGPSIYARLAWLARWNRLLGAQVGFGEGSRRSAL